MITHTSLSLSTFLEMSSKNVVLVLPKNRTTRESLGPTMAVTRTTYFHFFICDCCFLTERRNTVERETNLQAFCRIITRLWETVLFPAEREEICPLIGHLGRRTRHLADNEMNVCRRVCGRIFGVDDVDVGVTARVALDERE